MARITVKNPSEGEVELAARIAARAFPNAPIEFWMESFGNVSELFGNRFILIAELDGEPVSSLICHPAPIYINEVPVPHSGVGAVGTVPERRRTGCAGAMMAECARMLREEGIYLSSLWPASYEYYRKFGWEVGGEFRSYVAEGKFFAEHGEAAKARKGSPSDAGSVKRAYESVAPFYNGLAERYDKWWEKVVKLPRYLGDDFPDHGAAVCEDEESGSYMLYEVARREDKTTVEVKESIISDNEQRRHMLAVIGSEYPDCEITFYAPDTDLYLHEIPNPRAVRAGVHPSAQFRITDPEKAMESLAVMEHVEGRLTLSIHDPVFQSGFEFGIEVADGEVSLCKPESGRAIEMSVMTLAKLYNGYISPFDAHALGEITLRRDGPEELVTACEIFCGGTPYRTWLEPG